MKEIEIKVQLENSNKLTELLKREAKLIKEERQIDEYFSPKENSFTAEDPVKEWLRLRDENGVCSINYKYWHYDSAGRSNHCDEYETTIKNAQEMRSILTALKFDPIIVVDKARKSYLYGEYEVSIDEVKNLGSFVEIELKSTKEVDPQQATDAMIEFLQKFDPGKVKRDFKGYPKLLLDQLDQAHGR